MFSWGDGCINVQVLVFGLDLFWEMIYCLYVVVIYEVCEWVWLVILYFVFGEVVCMVLILAVFGGLDVCLLVLKMSDFWFVIQVVCLYFDELLQVGVKIYEYGLCMLYIKVFIVDDDVCIVGSVNFDYCSFCFNFELLMMFGDVDCVVVFVVLFSVEFDVVVLVCNDCQCVLWCYWVFEVFVCLVLLLF